MVIPDIPGPLADYHIHTVYSGHAAEDARVEAMIRRAEQLGLEWVAFLEHYDEPAHQAALDTIRREVAQAAPRIGVMVGAECTLACDGPPALNGLPRNADLIGFSVHQFPSTRVMHFEKADFSPQERRRIFETWLYAVERVLATQPVDLYCHPFFAMPVVGIIADYRDGFAERVRPILSVMAEWGIAFELNATMPRKNPPGMLAGYEEIVRLARSLGVTFAVGSDSHSVACVGERDWIIEMAERIGLGPKDFARFASRGRVAQ